VLRFVIYAIPLLFLLLALFGFAVDLLDLVPGDPGAAAASQLTVPVNHSRLVFSIWLVEAFGLVALFLLLEGRCGTWWLDGLVTGWVAWIFRGPLLVVTMVVVAGGRQEVWWRLAFGWWVLYSLCGLSLAILARRLDRAAAGRQTPVPASSGEGAGQGGVPAGD
jgi:hypothetical protein